MTTHHRKPGGGTSCLSSSTRTLRTTSNLLAVECARCRKALGLGKYDPLAALKGIANFTHGENHASKT